MNPEELQEIKGTLNRIETALIGDPSMGNKGLVTRLKDVEDKTESIGQWRDSVKTKMTIIAGAVSVVGTVAAEQAMKILTKP